MLAGFLLRLGTPFATCLPACYFPILMLREVPMVVIFDGFKQFYFSSQLLYFFVINLSPQHAFPIISACYPSRLPLGVQRCDSSHHNLNTTHS